MNVDTDGLTFPSWPCFTILRPAENAEAFRAIDWPNDWALVAEVLTDGVAEVTAVRTRASYWVKQGGGTEEELRATLEPLDFVLL